MTRLVSIVCSVCLVVAGCGGSDSPSGPTAQPRGEFSMTDLVVGTGTAATAGRVVSVRYTGWLYDPTRPDNKGSQFDTSGTGTLPPFVLGAGSVIRGLDQGLVGMRVGGQRRLVIPPELGYGSQGNGPIPPNASLVFDVELVAVQ
jgi:FKBP-type peptidyl-prolyl cis-trans isomerase FkpA